ncbi:hypothetical protein AB0F18_10065 [Streptomyces sp. NPDC029216]|uniref:hypothetical protein n=1 Tax=Streptomyces sp. NPDC029216 TaxID=3154701 RepID=UPI0033E2C741
MRRRHRGVGAIVHAVAAAHGGTATVTSRPGHTEFRLMLPSGSPVPLFPAR